MESYVSPSGHVQMLNALFSISSPTGKWSLHLLVFRGGGSRFSSQPLSPHLSPHNHVDPAEVPLLAIFKIFQQHTFAFTSSSANCNSFNCSIWVMWKVFLRHFLHAKLSSVFLLTLTSLTLTTTTSDFK